MKLGRIIEIEESHHMAAILDCHGGHFESKMAAKMQKWSDSHEIWYIGAL